MVLFAFNFTVYESESKPINLIPMETEIDTEVIRTPRDEEKKLPTPDLKTSDNFIDDNVEFKEDPMPEPIDNEVNIDTQQIRPVAPIFTIKKPAPPKIDPVEVVDDPGDIEFIVVEEMPRFPGCEGSDFTKKEKKACADKALLEYIYKNIRYPKMASSNSIEGTVVLDFVVEKNGQISDVNIKKEIGGGCGTEVVRVVNKMPDWVPGKQRGREVRVRYMLPVKFKLQ